MLRCFLKLHKRYNRKPDFEEFRRAILDPAPGHVPVGDLFADFESISCFLDEPVIDGIGVTSDKQHKITLKDLTAGYRYVEQSIRFCINAGWDYVWSFSSIPFPGFMNLLAENTAPAARGRLRAWVNDNRGPITSWNEFEQYNWPTDFHGINFLSRLVAQRCPDGLKVMVIPGGVFEWTTWLMGLVPFSYALVDTPDLVQAVIEKVTASIIGVVEDLLDEPNLGGFFMGDDLGFASGTMVSPAVLRKYFMPQTKKVVQCVRQTDKLFLFHSCGNMYSMMPDLLEMGVQGKHSFEDKIRPVESVYNEWGAKMALIGGMDVHLLATGTEDAIRKRVREILDVCGSGGHYVFGTGNSVANYIPIDNYRIMLDEHQSWNEEHFPHE